tara:strand:- start:51 stop:866 length:816 start_codon:yes stop_codon:yes gene_type:complete
VLLQCIKKLIAVAPIVVLHFSISGTTLAQPPGPELDRTIPTPRLNDGKIDFGGDGVWSLPYIRNFADRIVGGDENSAVPFLPWTEAMHEYNASNNVAYDPEGFCLPPGGPRSMATPYPAEIIQHRDRIIIIFEGGGHVWREIHMDGREHPDLETYVPSYFGHSVGHWENDTLVVDTVGYNEKTWLDFGGHMHSDQLHTIEYITRTDKNTLHYEATIDDPGAYTEPWTIAWDINWSEGQELADYICQENNKYMIDLVDDFGNPFFESTPVAR